MLIEPIVGPRLTLRTLTDEAATGPYLGWMQDPEVLRYLEARHVRHDAASLIAFIRAANASAAALLMGLFERESDQHVGNIKLEPIDRINRRAELGLIVGDRSKWGRGYGRESIGLIAGYAFSALGLHKLTAGLLEPNLASRKAFAAAGFAVEACLAQHFLFEGRWVEAVRMAKFGSG
jgi:RimJ/RimL family protein N-acetyltransferase